MKIRNVPDRSKRKNRSEIDYVDQSSDGDDSCESYKVLSSDSESEKTIEKVAKFKGKTNITHPSSMSTVDVAALPSSSASMLSLRKQYLCSKCGQLKKNHICTPPLKTSKGLVGSLSNVILHVASTPRPSTTSTVSTINSLSTTSAAANCTNVIYAAITSQVTFSGGSTPPVSSNISPVRAVINTGDVTGNSTIATTDTLSSGVWEFKNGHTASSLYGASIFAPPYKTTCDWTAYMLQFPLIMPRLWMPIRNAEQQHVHSLFVELNYA